MYRPSARDFIRISCYLLILFAILITILFVFLSQLDLDNYRTTFENQLNTVLDQPVKIGHSALAFSHGLALSFDDVQIGSDEKPIVKIPHITATLKIIPLFDGRVVLNQIHVKDPEVQLWLPLPSSNGEGGSRLILQSLGVNSLSIEGGNLIIHQEENKTHPQFNVSNLFVTLEGWRLGQVGKLKASGNLDNFDAGFIFETRVPRYQGGSQWRKESYDTKLVITNFSTADLLPAGMAGIPQHVSVNLAISGAPATGATLNARFIGSTLKKTFFNISGLWLSAENQETITGIKGELLKIPLAGEIFLLRKDEKNYLSGKLGTQNITITPARLKAWNITNAAQFINGNLERFDLELKNSWKEDGSSLNDLSISGGLIARDLNWKKDGPLPAQELSLNFLLKNKVFSFDNGVLVTKEQPIAFSGKIFSIFHQPQIKMEVSSDPQLDIFTTQVLPEGWVLSGHVPIQLQLNGVLVNPHLHLKADLNQVQATLGSLFRKSLNDHAKLELEGHLDKDYLQLNIATLTLGDTALIASGYFQSTPEQTYQLAINPINLDQWQQYSPLLTKLNATGTLTAAVSQQQAGLQGSLNLDGVGAHLTSLIGDLNNTYGQIDLDRHGLTFQGLKASLGKSEFTLTGILSNWDNPHFGLDLSSKKVRARDLIFANRHLTLYDLDGHLSINKNMLEFSPVKVRLENETLATVTGSVSFSHPEVKLDIQSEKANIFDVINLFVGPHAPHPPGEKPHRVPVEITVDAQKGTLGGLQFQNAKGLIVSDDDRLTIFPLKFNSGEGWCQARILFDYDDDATPLKISGHTENIDATLLHQHLFERDGLINGRLEGDFYLEGNPADGQFWATAKGGIHAKVTDGVLRQFKGLAKVFSLLNISQLFSGNLPDIDREGMPFSLAEGSMLLDSGHASTNDLQVDSVAMNLSIVGSTDIINDKLDLNLGIMPLGTVDKIITTIPVAGWVLAGDNNALITAHFKIEGSSTNPQVKAVPIESVSDTVVGIFKRTFGLPGKLVKDIGTAFKKKPTKKGAE